MEMIEPTKNGVDKQCIYCLRAMMVRTPLNMSFRRLSGSYASETMVLNGAICHQK